MSQADAYNHGVWQIEIHIKALVLYPYIGRVAVLAVNILTLKIV
jgi:hypothetical protein